MKRVNGTSDEKRGLQISRLFTAWTARSWASLGGRGLGGGGRLAGLAAVVWPECREKMGKLRIGTLGPIYSGIGVHRVKREKTISMAA